MTKQREQVFELYARGLALFRERKFVEAEKQFRTALEIDPADGPSAELAQRCVDFQASPPGPEWDGTFAPDSK